jgi:hypothetical protein
VFSLFRAIVEESMLRFNFRIYSEKDKIITYEYTLPTGSYQIAAGSGNLTVTHYMTILQKATAFAMNLAYLILIDGLPLDYDFQKDIWKVKTKSRQRELRGMVMNPPTQQYIEKLLQLVPNVKTKVDDIRTQPFGYAICYFAMQAFFVDAGAPKPIKLENGQEAKYSVVFKIIQEINDKTTGDGNEIEVTYKNVVGDAAWYEITDHYKKTKEQKESYKKELYKKYYRNMDDLKEFAHPNKRPVPTYELPVKKTKEDAIPLVLPKQAVSFNSPLAAIPKFLTTAPKRVTRRAISSLGTADNPWVLDTPARPSRVSESSSSSEMALTPVLGDTE